MKLLIESSIQCPFSITAIQDKSKNNSQFQMNKCKAITQMKDKKHNSIQNEYIFF